MLFTAALNLIGDILLGQLWGVFGIFLATALARAFTNTWYEPFVIFKHGFHLNFASYIARYLLYACILVVTCGLCYAMCQMVEFSSVPRIIVKCLICIVFPNVIFILFFSKTGEFHYLLKAANMLKDKVITRLKRRA